MRGADTDHDDGPDHHVNDTLNNHLDEEVLDGPGGGSDHKEEFEKLDLTKLVGDATSGDTLDDEVPEGLIPAEAAGYGWLWAVGGWLLTFSPLLEGLMPWHVDG